jgi:mxaJ protein
MCSPSHSGRSRCWWLGRPARAFRRSRSAGALGRDAQATTMSTCRERARRPCHVALTLALVLVATITGAARGGDATTRPARVIRVVADPNNLPFSNDKLEGFENRIAELIARETGATIEYAWRAQRRGFFRHAFKDDAGDLVLGVPAGFDRALTTAPYYRSAYCFVSRKDRGLDVRSFDDPRLRELKVGVQVVGDDGADTPPAHALGRRGIVTNVVGFTLYGDYQQPNPTSRIMDAVARGDVDVAVVWGPLAGGYAKTSRVPLSVVPVEPARPDPSGMRFAFAIAVGVRRGQTALRDEVNAVLERHRDEIDRILDEYGVPRVPAPDEAAAADASDRSEKRNE